MYLVLNKRLGGRLKLVVYIDIYFLVNLIMDLIILVILSKFIQEPVRRVRFIAASTTGALGACVTIMNPGLYPSVSFLFNYVVIAVLMVRISYPYQGWRRLVTSVIKLYLLTCFIGGLLQFMLTSTDLSQIFGSIFQDEDSTIGVIVLILFSIVLFLIMPYFIEVIRGVRTKIDTIYQVKVIFDNRELVLKGLLDTGNDLREPISRKPVVIGEYEVLKQLLPKQLDEYTTRLKVIPYRSLGEEDGTLYGVVFDEIQVTSCGETFVKKDVIIGLYHGHLSSKKEYQLILHSDVLSR